MSLLSTRRVAALPLALTLMLAAACSDASTVTAPMSGPELEGPALARVAANSGSYVVSQRAVGDTIVTVFVVGTNTSQSTRVALGNSSRIDFPLSSGNICDIATSSYGPSTWNNRCAAATTPTRITAKTWLNEDGRLAADFEPAMRFRPGIEPVRITLRANNFKRWRIDYCTRSGCINEARTDPSLVSVYDEATNTISRIIKHFSGYTVTAD